MRTALVLLLLASLSSPAQEIDPLQLEPDLELPKPLHAPPAPGVRAIQFHPGNEGSGLHHILHLPTDWAPGKSWPVIVEYAGNRHRHGSGGVESSKLGYGVSGGKGAIWLCLPFVDAQRKANAPMWWGDAAATVAYCKRTVKQVCRDYGGDPGRVVLAGFSRGSIACNFIGLHDDEIAGLWCGFICHSHYEGVGDWPMSTRAEALDRLKRLGDRPQFISHEASVEATRNYLRKVLPQGNFTFLALPFDDHTDRWVLCDLPARSQLRDWFGKVVRK